MYIYLVVNANQKSILLEFSFFSFFLFWHEEKNANYRDNKPNLKSKQT